MVTSGDISRLVFYILHNTIIQIAFIIVIDDILYQAIKGKALEEKTYCSKNSVAISCNRFFIHFSSSSSSLCLRCSLPCTTSSFARTGYLQFHHQMVA